MYDSFLFTYYLFFFFLVSQTSFYNQKLTTALPVIEQIPETPLLVGVTLVLTTYNQTRAHIHVTVFQSLLDISKPQVGDHLEPALC